MESHVLNLYHQTKQGSIARDVGSSRASIATDTNFNIPEHSQSEMVTLYEAGCSSLNCWVSGETSQVLKTHTHNATAQKNYDQINVICNDEPGTEWQLCEWVQVITVDPNKACADEDGDEHSPENTFSEHHVLNNQIQNRPSHQNGFNMNFNEPESQASTTEDFFKDSLDIILPAEQVTEVTNVDDFFTKNIEDTIQKNFHQFATVTSTVSGTSTHDRDEVVRPMETTDLDALLHKEGLESFLFDELPHNKLNSIQRSNSLPQTPLHPDLDKEDGKSCLTLEDLNLSDLTFDNEKVSILRTIKNDGFPAVLSEEEINDILNTNQPIHSIIDDVAVSRILPDRNTSTPLPMSESECPKILTDRKEDDFVDIESCNEINLPVLAATNIDSLWFQFEAAERVNNQANIVPTECFEQSNVTDLTGMTPQVAGVANEANSVIPPTGEGSPTPSSSDHNYSKKKSFSKTIADRGRSLLRPDVLSSNSKIHKTRHRSCKSKCIVYHQRSDDESESVSSKKHKNNTEVRATDSDLKKKKRQQYKLNVQFQDQNSNGNDFLTGTIYNGLISNKQEVQLPQPTSEKSEDVKKDPAPEVNTPKRKLNLEQYKLRRGAKPTNSVQVNTVAIFPDSTKNISNISHQSPSVGVLESDVNSISDSKTVFDPIGAASRKILMKSRMQKAAALRKRDEEMVMSKIPIIKRLELKPLLSEAEVMEIVGTQPEIIPLPMPALSNIKQKYDEIVIVSIGTNTDHSLFRKSEKEQDSKNKLRSPPGDSKSTFNFKIKKLDPISSNNMLNAKQLNRSPAESNRSDYKIDKDRFNDIRATLKSVEKQVDSKISSNSLFSSIQDVVQKHAPAIEATCSNVELRLLKSTTPKYTKATIVREYDANMDHGEDKVILHLEKSRIKPNVTSSAVQTDYTCHFRELLKIAETLSPSPRKRSDSEMLQSTKHKSLRARKNLCSSTVDDRLLNTRDRSRSKEKRSRSRRDVNYRRSNSHSRGHRRSRSPNTNRSRSRGAYKRHRPSDSPYRKRSKCPYRSRRSPSPRHSYRPKQSEQKIKSPDNKKNTNHPRTNDKYAILPIRKLICSQSSSPTSGASSSSCSSSSTVSTSSSGNCSGSYRKQEFRINHRSSHSSEDRESNTPVEERRIVFVGRLEKTITKHALRAQFIKFGIITEVRLHSKDDGTRYGFLTFARPNDAWVAVAAANTYPQYDIGFGGRRAFCRQRYADLDGMEAKFSEGAFHGRPTLPTHRNNEMSFDQILEEMKHRQMSIKNNRLEKA